MAMKSEDRPPLPRRPAGRGVRDYCPELTLFNEIATISSYTQDLQEIVDLILDALLDFFRIDAGILLLWDGRRRRLSNLAARGFPPDYLEELTSGGLEEIITPYLTRAAAPLLIRDLNSDPRVALSTFSRSIQHYRHYQSLVSIPLKFREQVTGFLNLASAHPDTFCGMNPEFYAILGNQIGLAIANACLYRDLKRSERRYRRIFEGCMDLIFVTDRDGLLLDMNPAGLELLGVAAKEQVLGTSFRRFLAEPRDWERFLEAVEQDGFARDLGLTLKRTDGGTVPALLTGIGRRTPDGLITGYEGFIKDITLLKESEEALLREKTATQWILDGLPLPTFVIDRHHRIIAWNRACEELTGCSRKEMIGTFSYWLPFYSPEGPSMASLMVEHNFKALERFFGNKDLKRSPYHPVAYEAYEYFPDFRGRERSFYCTSSPIYGPEGQVLGAVQSIVDITEREQLARQLKESEEKYRLLAEASLDGILLHREGRILYANPAALEMFGCEASEEMLGREFTAFLNLPGPERAREQVLRLLKGHSTPRIFELKGQRKDGSCISLEAISFPTTYEGAPASQTHLRDITRKKQLEEHLAHTEKLAALGQLAAGVAHEMNNPLGTILVLSYLLLEDLERESPEWGQVEKIVREATRCKEIVKGLLEFSRYTPARMVPVNLNEILDNVLALVSDHLLFQSVEVVRLFQPHLPPVLGDRSRLEQVFINLLLNGAEAMEGRGRLTVSTEVAQGGELVRVRFTDTGPGIPESHLSRLFDPFFTTKEVGKGVGLGLSISYGIIEKHLGRIAVADTGPHGTTFVVELPTARPGALGSEAHP
ncbi:MAG: PAS domain S-box protein [Syntrophobacterales bacterium]|nr:PAS domain S-box protein [Syntrophobacterales bacterium]